MIQIGPLTVDQRRALEQVRRRAVGRVSQRAHMVLLNARGYSVAQIATIFEVGADVVRDWLHRYQQQGPPGLDDCPRPGRPPRERLARQIVDTQASNAPRNHGLVQAGWTVGLLRRSWRRASAWCWRPAVCGGICKPAAGAGLGPAWRRPRTRRAASARRIRKRL